MYQTKQFEKDLEALQLNLNQNQMDQFMKYYKLLLEWNSFMNLTAIIQFDDIMKKHFIDSLSLVKAVQLNNELKVIDIGTGAGFPGIPLKIVFPHLKVTLLDSLNKRVKFLEEVIEQLGLSEIEAIHGRAEEFSKAGMMREQYDLCVSRAVANLTTLSEYCLPYVKPGGKFIAYKSEKIADEVVLAERVIQILGGKIGGQVEMKLPDSSIYRNLFIIDKVKNTPKKFPRKPGLAAKEPL